MFLCLGGGGTPSLNRRVPPYSPIGGGYPIQPFWWFTLIFGQGLHPSLDFGVSLPELVLCRFDFIHFWTPFISLHLSTFSLISSSTYPFIWVLCRFGVLHFQTLFISPFINLSRKVLFDLCLCYFNFHPPNVFWTILDNFDFAHPVIISSSRPSSFHLFISLFISSYLFS